jgi:PAS domain S-box-containing protein
MSLFAAVPDVRTSSTTRRGRRARTHVDTTHTPNAIDSGLRVDQLFDLARDALVVAELGTGRILRWNQSAELLFGYSPSQVIGRPVQMLMPPAVAHLHRERIAHFEKTGEGEVLDGREPLGVPALTRSGEEIRVQLSIQPLEMSGGQTRALLFTFRDAAIDQRAELSTLEAARARSEQADVEAKLRRCEEVLRESTRELERPLAWARRAAARMTRLASEGEAQPQRLALLAQVIEGRTDNLQRSLEQIVDTATIAAGAFELRPERANLVPLVGRLVATARTRSEAHRFNFAAPQGLTALCDPRRVESVVHDIIDRAMRRNPRGCWIDVDLRRPLPGVARIEIRDYGRPVSDQERRRLTHASAGDRGWFVNRYIIEQHGGSLTIEFPPEGGMRVVVSLPTNHTRLLSAPRSTQSRGFPSGETRKAAASSATSVW